MILRILSFLAPHFITRCILKDQWGKTQAICRGKIIGNDLAIEEGFTELAKNCPVIDIVLGLSWFGWAIFFWLKDSYDQVKV